MSDRKKRVLIVDDEEDLTWTLAKKLSKDNDKFELITVNSGQEAINVLNQLPVDLVISDVRMPEISGLDLLVKIRETYPNTKVVIMTAYGSSDVQKEANERGCFKYIEKPFEINELRQLILDALKDEKGFRGTVADFQLSDIIQLNCLGRLTSALHIQHGNEEGYIYFQDGNIVHAETNHFEGEKAFYYIMSWEGGEFRVLRNQLPPRETIQKGWQSLLLESLRLKDESSDLAKAEIEREKRKRQRQLRRIFDRVTAAEGIKDVLVHTHAGFPIFYRGQLEGQTEEIAQLGDKISALLEGIEKAGTPLFGQHLFFWEGHFLNHTILIFQIPGEDAYVSIIGNRELNSGLVRLEMKKHLNKLKELIAE